MRFVLVDRILELDPGREITATRFIDPEEDYFKDHFPGFPVVPGVLLTEMMAQTAGKCLDAEHRPRGKAMLAEIRSARFRHWVRPQETVLISATVRTNREAFAVADCSVQVGQQLAASAELLFTFVPADRFAADFEDQVLKQFEAQQKRTGNQTERE